MTHLPGLVCLRYLAVQAAAEEQAEPAAAWQNEVTQLLIRLARIRLARIELARIELKVDPAARGRLVRAYLVGDIPVPTDLLEVQCR